MHGMLPLCLPVSFLELGSLLPAHLIHSHIHAPINQGFFLFLIHMIIIQTTYVLTHYLGFVGFDKVEGIHEKPERSSGHDEHGDCQSEGEGGVDHGPFISQFRSVVLWKIQTPAHILSYEIQAEGEAQVNRRSQGVTPCCIFVLLQLQPVHVHASHSSDE